MRKISSGIKLQNTSAIALVFLLLCASQVAFADENVRAYHRKNGKFVEQHKRTNPDGRKYNNYSSEGSTNPYTGKKGHKRNQGSKHQQKR